jgi:predicted transcriptional regulator
MKARDIMAAPVITVSPHTTIKNVAETFLKYHISGPQLLVMKYDFLHESKRKTEYHPSCPRR